MGTVVVPVVGVPVVGVPVVGATVAVVVVEEDGSVVAGALVDVVEGVLVIVTAGGAVEVLDEAIVEDEESPELLQAPSAAITMAAEAAAFHALLMATPPSGGC